MLTVLASENARHASRGFVRLALLYAAAGLAFASIAFLAIELTRGDGRIAMVWIPNAIAVAVLLRWDVPREYYLLAALWLGNLTANLSVGDQPLIAAALATSNIVEIAAALGLTRRFIGSRPDIQKIEDLIRFVGLAGLCAPAVSASVAMVALGTAGATFLSGWLTWTLTDGLGMILIAPALLVFIDAARNPRALSKREATEWVILTFLGTAITASIFVQTQYPLLFLLAPVVLSHAFRLGSLGTAFSIFKIGIIATVCTWLDRGPIHLLNQTENLQLVILQAFLASAFVVGFPVAALLNRQRQMLVEMEDREAQLSLLADNMSDAVMRYDTDGRCTYASASVIDVLGRSSDCFVGHRANENVHPDAEAEISNIQSQLVTGEIDKARFTYRRVLDDSDGMPVFIEANCVLVRDPATQQPETIIVSCRDVSDRERLEKNLVRARRHAENAAIAKSQFLANMSHEIRTPMNGVLGFVELLLQSNLSTDQRRHAELVQESGNSMMRLLNDILDISKIEAGEMAVAKETIDIRNLVTSCLTLHSANAAQRQVTLINRSDPDLPNPIITDSLRLRQILLNLLSNAVKFTDKGIVTLETAIEHDAIIFAVQDSGIGIEHGRLEAIFNPFEQADNATSRKFGGTGLGLTISRHLAELLGGSLSATSVPGEGSRFELRLPLVEPTRAKPSVDTAPEAAAADPSNLIAGSRILLAEDHDINRMLVTAMLEKCGQSVNIAEDGEQAVAAVMEAQASGAPFDLVLMDIQMPECDGYTATATLRELGLSAEQLPIVALTANAFEDDVRAAKNAGMQGHLAKPLQFGALVETLQRFLRTAGAEVSAAALAPLAEVSPQNPLEEDFSRKPSLEQRWQQRRAEAVNAVSEALRKGDFEGDAADELALIVHKLAGTAGMFGEDRLGAKAGALERSLKSSTDTETRVRLAADLLKVA